MPKLIDKDELKKAIEKNICEVMCDEPRGCSCCRVDDVWEVIYEMPTVDAEPVVRCKDCIHYWKNKPSEDVPVCLASPKDDAFCSEGERGEDVRSNDR